MIVKFKEWNEIAELVGIAAVVGSLIFVGLQMKQAQDIAQAERRSLLVSNEIEMGNAITANADIWRKGLAGDELDAAESVVFENLVLMKVSFHFHTARAAQNLDARNGYEGHITLITELLHTSPSARKVWVSHLELSRKTSLLIFPTSTAFHFMQDEVLSALAKLDEAQL